MKNKKTSVLQTVLTVLFVAALLISNIIGFKQFQLPFGDIVVTSAICVFPITYILSDVFSEVYGYEWSRITCYLAFALNLLMVLFFQLAINMPYPNYFTGQDSMAAVLGNTPRMLAASLIAYFCGDLINDIIFQKMKDKHKNETKGFKSRALLSSVAGNFVDSAIFNPLAFLGIIPLNELVVTIITYSIAKTIFELIFIPLTELVARKVKKVEDKIA